jgi:DNA polymerase-3 subunit delta'
VKLSAVIGHERAVARLAAAAGGTRLPHAVLLLGPAGVGKRTLADAFAARLLCAAPAGGDACGVCAQCTRLPAGTHPDLHVVTRQEERRDVRIEQVRELTRGLAFQPLMAARKVAIVDDAHCLNEQAQNALLKTLEEPPGASVLVLLATAPALILPTVRSRCQVIRLDPLPADAVVRVLTAQGMPAERARLLAPLAEGSPGRVLALEGDAAAAARERLLATLPGIAAAPAVELSALAQDLGRGALDVALAAAVGWYRDVLHAALLGAAAPLANQDVAPAVRAAAAGADPTRILRQLEAVCATIDAVARNANRTLAMETLLLVLREIARGGDPDLQRWTSTTAARPA